MSPGNGGLPALAIGLAFWLGSGAPTALAEEIVDWPCEAPYAEAFAPEAAWGESLPGPLPADWRADGQASRVVGFAADPENGLEAGRKRIADFAGATPDPERRRDALLAVYAGLIESFSRQRGFLLEGVRDNILRAKVLNEVVEANKARAASLGEGPEAEKLRAQLAVARRTDFRNMDTAVEAAEFICHRYAYLDEKLRALVAEIRKDL